jgi:hypothetical protein
MRAERPGPPAGPRREACAPSPPGVSRRGIEILARSIYRDLSERGCTRVDVIRLATALLDQLLAPELSLSTEAGDAAPVRRSA